MQLAPELLEAVFDGCACERDARLRIEAMCGSRNLAFWILDCLGFIQDDAVPLDRLEQIGVRYMVTGSVAGMLYGEPRLTHDIDVVLELATDTQAEALVGAFPDEAFYCAPLEVVLIEARRSQRGHFNIIHHDTGFKADVYLACDDLHRQALQQRHVLEIEGTRLQVAPPEYVIVRKLEYYREGGSIKHLNDIRGMLRISGEQIDRDVLKEMISSRGLVAEWDAVDKA